MMNSSIPTLSLMEDDPHYDDTYNNNGTLQPPNNSQEYYSNPVILRILMICICIIGLVGNGIVISLLGFQVKRSPFTTYILNLAVADFGVLLFTSLDILINKETFLQDIIMTVFSTIMYSASQLLLTTISIDRCVSILFPIWHRCHRPPHLPTTVCALMWVLACLPSGSVAIFFNWTFFENSFIYSFFFYQFIAGAVLCLPLVAISTMILLYKVSCKLQKPLRGRPLTIVLLTLLFFLIFAFPLNAILTLHYFASFKYYYLIQYGFLCACLNSCVNPVIYYLVGRKTRGQQRQSLKVILQRAFKEQEEESEERGTTAQTENIWLLTKVSQLCLSCDTFVRSQMFLVLPIELYLYRLPKNVWFKKICQDCSKKESLQVMTNLSRPTLSLLEDEPHYGDMYNNNGTSSSSKNSLGLFSDDFVNILTLCISIIGLLGNGPVICLLGFHVKRSPFTTFILNLAVADFGVLLFTGVDISTNRFSFVGGTIVTEIATLMYTASQLLLTTISIDRCMSILFPIWHRCHRPPHLSIALCALMWIHACLPLGSLETVSLLGQYSDFLYFVLFIVGAILCLPLVTISTMILFFKMSCKSQQPKRRRLLTIVLLTLLFFLIFAFPLNAIFTVYYIKGSVYVYLVDCGFLCACLNSSVNPVIYYLVGRKKRSQQRQSLKVILQRAFKEEEEQTEEGGTTAQMLP